MLADRLEKAWRTRREAGTIDPLMRFAGDGLVLGAGTVLVASGASGRDVTIDPLEPRLRALLAAAHLGRPRVQALAHLRKAADAWRQGDNPLAAMHLVLSGLDRLQHPETDAHRLFLADALLREGVAADAIIAVAETGDLRKFDPDQPRVSAGSGRTSGQWTSGGAASGSASPDADDVRPASATTDTNEPQASGPRPIPNATVGEVNAASPNLQAAHTQGLYAGPDACTRARKDCCENIYLRTDNHEAANDTWDKNAMMKCFLAESTCEIIGAAVDRTPFFESGWVLYPDGGVVVARKGYLQDYVYYPDGTHIKGRPFPPGP